MSEARKQAAEKLTALTEAQLRMIVEALYLGLYHDRDPDVLRRGARVDPDIIDDLDGLFAKLGVVPPGDSREKTIRDRCLADASSLGWNPTWRVHVYWLYESGPERIGTCMVAAANEAEAIEFAIDRFTDAVPDSLLQTEARIEGRVDYRESDSEACVARDLAVGRDATNSIEDLLVGMYEMAIEGLAAYDDEVRESVEIWPLYDGRIGYRLVRIEGGLAQADFMVYYVPPGEDES